MASPQAKVKRDPKTGHFKGHSPAAARRTAAEAQRADLEKRHSAATEENARLRRSNEQLTKEAAALQKLLDRYSTIKPAHMKVPPWLKMPAKATKAHHATPVLMLSDLHLDERVDLDEMDGINSYDRAIAETRLDRVINRAVMLLRRHVAGVHYDGIVVALLGDIITGEIHEELARTNEAPPPATIAHWVPTLPR